MTRLRARLEHVKAIAQIIVLLPDLLELQMRSAEQLARLAREVEKRAQGQDDLAARVSELYDGLGSTEKAA